MKNLLDVAKATIIGGFFGLLPIVGIILVVAEALSAVAGFISPIAESLPVETVGGVEVAHLIAIVIVAGFCFLAGLFLQTGVGSRTGDWLDERVLGRIPGYTMLKTLSETFAGKDESSQFSPAAVDLAGNGAWSIAFIVDEQPNTFTVLVPVAPTPNLGQIYVLPANRVRRLAAPLGSAVHCVMQWGIGSAELLATASPPIDTAENS